MTKIIDEVIAEADRKFFSIEDDLDAPPYGEVLVLSAVERCLKILQARFMGDLNREDMEVRRCIEDIQKKFGIDK